MDPSKSLQYRRTDREIVRAFLTLLKTIPFEKMTVNDIAGEAMISRNAFYQHYADKYALAQSIYDQFLSDFRSFRTEVYTEEGPGLFQMPEGERNRMISGRFADFAAEHRRMIEGLLKIHTDTINLSGVLKDTFREEYIRDKNHEGMPREILEREALIYASMMEALTESAPNNYSDTDMNLQIMHAALYALGIRHKALVEEGVEDLYGLRVRSMKEAD